MKRSLKNLSILGLLFITVFTLTKCSNSGPATSRLEVRLTDGPGDYQEVNIDIQGVEIHTDGGDPSNGWKPLSIKTGVYNLLKLTNGLDTLLGSIELPAGHIEQIRLKLGTNNSIKVNGVTSPLNTPSAQQSGLKLVIKTDLQAGITYKLLLDFDAARSIVSTGSGKFNLKPVIKTTAEATSGAVKGIVAPIAAAPAIFVISGTDTVATSYADQTTGKFLLKGLSTGTYKIEFMPKSGFTAKEKTGVNVTVGTVTDLGTIQF